MLPRFTFMHRFQFSGPVSTRAEWMERRGVHDDVQATKLAHGFRHRRLHSFRLSDIAPLHLQTQSFCTSRRAPVPRSRPPRSACETLAPPAAKRLAIARPMPVVPVTIATLPSNSFMQPFDL